MVFLLDTNAVSDLMGANPAVDACLAAVAPDDRVVVCTIVRGEILYGIERLAEGKRKDDFKSKAARIFSFLPCEGLTQSIGDIYARVKASCMRRGLPLDDNDLWIAATAIESGAVLVTRDRDFRHVEGLTSVDWSIPRSGTP